MTPIPTRFEAGSPAPAPGSGTSSHSPPSRVRTRVSVRILAGLLVVGATQLVDELVDPGFGEPLALRWLRMVHDHPVRTFLAILLLGFAVAPAMTREPERRREPRS